MTIFWFRRDLRLHDNAALYSALKNSEQVLPIFIFDPHILEQLPKDDARVSFISQQLDKIEKILQAKGKSLATFYDNPIDVFKKIIIENDVTAVYTNHDYEPYARKRDKAVFELLKSNNIAFKTAKDQVIFEKNEVVKPDGTPYVVYTPYSKKWLEKFHNSQLITFPSEKLLDKLATHKYPYLKLKDIQFVSSKIEVPEYSITQSSIENYQSTRNFPALASTSFLSTHLRFGTVSIREIVNQVKDYSDPTFLKELIWREFFMQILWHFPHTVNESFKPKYDAIQWKNNETLFKLWCEGKTGYPIVDAGMRELNATGLMHNRVRMVTASFLCKHLLIDWRWGEAYFAQKLLDYEQSSNIGNWQWVAGCGVDAAPYFRIFNPIEQLKKFDSKLIYTKKWVPGLETASYPTPIVNHKEAREECLRVYKEAVS